MDLSIPGNNPLRAQIRAETIRFKDAMELFGGEYPLGKIESSLKDPMKKRDIINLNVPAMDDIIKTIEYREKFKRDLRLGNMPKTKSTDAYAQAKERLESMETSSLPLTSKNVEPVLNSRIIGNVNHPRVNQKDALRWYAEDIHPQGPEDFYGKYDKNKVLRDLSNMDLINGSRMTNLGRSLLGPAGAYAGAALDQATSQVFRSTARLEKNPMYQGLKKSTGTAQMAKYYNDQSNFPDPANGIPYDKLAGTKYEGQFIAAMNQDPKKAAILHYMLSQNDPEYQALVNQRKGI